MLASCTVAPVIWRVDLSECAEIFLTETIAATARTALITTSAVSGKGGEGEGGVKRIMGNGRLLLFGLWVDGWRSVNALSVPARLR